MNLAALKMLKFDELRFRRSDNNTGVGGNDAYNHLGIKFFLMILHFLMVCLKKVARRSIESIGNIL